MAFNTIVYTILVSAVTYLMLTFFLLFSRSILPHWWANGVTGVLTVVFVSPFMRAIVMKKNHSEEWQQLWALSPINRLPLISTVVARAAICLAFLFYITNYLARFADAIVLCIGIIVITVMILSRTIKQRSIKLERMFKNNLRSRDIMAQVKGSQMPEYANHLIERDLNLAEVVVPENSLWAGKTLAELQLGQNFGIHVSSILRNGRRMNIPYGKEQIFSNDRLQVIGTDEQITHLNKMLLSAIYPVDTDYEEKEMILRQIIVSRNSPLLGKALRNSRLREDFSLLVVGIEQGQPNLTTIDPDYIFQFGDAIWMVGERSSFDKIDK